MALTTQLDVRTGAPQRSGGPSSTRRHGGISTDGIGHDSSRLAFRPDPAAWLAELDRAPRSSREASASAPVVGRRSGGGVHRAGRTRAGLLVGLMLALAIAWSVAGWVAGPGSGVDPVGAGITPEAWTIVVVQPGDTLWSIAAEIDPDGDIRATVDRLAQRNGGSTLTVGQRLVVSG